MQKMLKPLALKAGDTVGIVAPAGLYESEQLEAGIDVLEKMGFEVHVPADLVSSARFMAGPDEHRADIFNRAFRDDSIQGVFCARGGYGSLRILDLIDYDMIEKRPKVFVGFSDITAVHQALMSRCGLVTFHGPVVTRLGEADQKTLDGLVESVSVGRNREVKPANVTVVQQGRCEGVVAGGNLTTLCHLLGTPDTPIFENRILILEDIAEAPYKIDRKLFHLKRSGCLDGVRGIVLGDFTDCGEYGELIASVEDIFGGMDIPILAGFNFGHARTNLTIPLGLPAVLDTAEGSLAFMEPATRG